VILILYFFFIFICLFILYAVSRHDFVLIRQSISLRQIFDNAFISIFVAFVIARIFYAFYAFTFEILNPLRFFYLTKYWGVVPYAGFAAFLLSLYLLFRNKKNKRRIFDIYFLSFSPIMLLDILLKPSFGINIFLKTVAIIVLIAFYVWFIKIHNKFTTKDGFITLLIIITYSMSSLALSFSTMGVLTKIAWFQIVLIVVTLISFLLLYLVQKDYFDKK
jgi:hypothetical protein